MEDAAGQSEPDDNQQPKSESKPSRPGSKDRQRIEQLFTEACNDRSRASELKQELDRQGLFDEFEDRFLDLFKEP